MALCVLLLASTATAGKPALPFVGTRLVNFEGGTGTGYAIAIAPDGHTQVFHLGVCETAVMYRGPYQERLPLDVDVAMALTKTRARLLRRGKLATSCEGVCTAPVSKPAAKHPFARGLPRPGPTGLCD